MKKMLLVLAFVVASPIAAHSEQMTTTVTVHWDTISNASVVATEFLNWHPGCAYSATWAFRDYSPGVDFGRDVTMTATCEDANESDAARRLLAELGRDYHGGKLTFGLKANRVIQSYQFTPNITYGQ